MAEPENCTDLLTTGGATSGTGHRCTDVSAKGCPVCTKKEPTEKNKRTAQQGNKNTVDKTKFSEALDAPS